MDLKKNAENNGEFCSFNERKMINFIELWVKQEETKRFDANDTSYKNRFIPQNHWN